MSKLGNFVLGFLLPSRYIRSKYRVSLMNKFGGNVDKSAEIIFGLKLNSYNISIGAGSFINQNCSLYTGYEQASIILEENVYLGMDVLMTCISHEIGDSHKRAGENTYGQIVVKKGSWIGARAVILPNVTIAEGCVIAAGSVVTQSTEANWLYGGVPARKIKKLDVIQ